MLRGFVYGQTLIVIIVKGIKGIGVVCHHLKKGIGLIRGNQRLVLQGASNHSHQLAQLSNLLLADVVINGIAFYEVFFQDAISPFTELNTSDTLYPIADGGDHFKIEILNLMRLGFALNGTMLSGIRKFCDNHFIGQFLFESIVNMLADGLVITTEQRGQLSTCQPQHITVHLDFKLNGIALILVYDNLILHTTSL